MELETLTLAHGGALKVCLLSRLTCVCLPHILLTSADRLPQARRAARKNPVRSHEPQKRTKVIFSYVRACMEDCRAFRNNFKRQRSVNTGGKRAAKVEESKRGREGA